MNTPERVEIKYKNYRVVVAEANARAGMVRSILVSKAIAEENALGEPKGLEESAMRLMHTVLYPSMVAAVVEHSGFEQWPVPFDEFCALPDSFVTSWQNATFELNPHWLPKIAEGNEEKKKKR